MMSLFCREDDVARLRLRWRVYPLCIHRVHNSAVEEEEVLDNTIPSLDEKKPLIIM